MDTQLFEALMTFKYVWISEVCQLQLLVYVDLELIWNEEQCW